MATARAGWHRGGLDDVRQPRDPHESRNRCKHADVDPPRLGVPPREFAGDRAETHCMDEIFISSWHVCVGGDGDDAIPGLDIASVVSQGARKY